MTRELTREDSGTEFIQFRGAQTTVTLDDYPVVFEMETRNFDGAAMRCHKPFPVVGENGAISMEKARESEKTAIIDEIAEELTETNPMIAYGVACERCESVFETPQGLSGHMHTHADSADEDTSDESDDSNDDADTEREDTN